MTERLTVSLEDGSIAKLRELAGGERKVGAYLTTVTAWLWKLQIVENSPVNAQDVYQKLVALAGDESKLPAFFLDVVAWLYRQRDALEAAPLHTYVLRPWTDEKTKQLLDRMQVVIDNYENMVEEDRLLIEDMERRLATVEKYSPLLQALAELTPAQLDAMEADAAKPLPLEQKLMDEKGMSLAELRRWIEQERASQDTQSDAKQLQGKDSQEDAKDNADGDAK